jgi:hypothetical protein
MGKTFKKNSGKKAANSHYEDGFHSKQTTRAVENRKKLKQFENALRSKDLGKIISYDDQL